MGVDIGGVHLPSEAEVRKMVSEEIGRYHALLEEEVDLTPRRPDSSLSHPDAILALRRAFARYEKGETP